MSLFGKSLRDYATFARTGMILILLMGLVRFLVGISGVPYERSTHLLSLTILTALLALVHGQKAAATGFGGYRHLLPIVFMLAAAMYGFIILAILVEGFGGIHGYFHAPGSGLAPAGMDMASHITGQLIAMLVATALFWVLAGLGFLLWRYLSYLRNAFLLLAAMTLLRAVVGATGLPYSVGTWMTSISLLSLALAVYYGYRAPSRGFTRYSQMLLVGALIAACSTLLVIYGIAVTTSLGIPNYFHAPGEGFQSVDWSIGQHVKAHLQASILVMVITSAFAAVGFFLGRRSSPASATA